MRYNLPDGKRITIPDEFIEKNMRNLGLTRAEAVELYLSDEGIEVNETVKELTEKAKAAGVGAKATGEKAKRKPPTRKEDVIKRAMVAGLAEYISAEDGTSEVKVTNPERMIAFEYAGEKYELTLTRKRKPKE